MYQGPPQPHLGGMSPFSAAPSLVTRVLGESDAQLERARLRARRRRRARRTQAAARHAAQP